MIHTRINSFTALLLLATLCLLSHTRDAWKAARLTVQEVRAAEFRAQSATDLKPYREQLRRIAIEGIASPEDAKLAQTLAGIMAADVCLWEAAHE